MWYTNSLIIFAIIEVVLIDVNIAQKSLCIMTVRFKPYAVVDIDI